MAESQVPFPYDGLTIEAIKASLSQPRFATYLGKAGGNESYAIALYLYNSRLAKSFLFPLSVAEITLRNAVNRVLVEKYGDNWHQNCDFRDNVLTEESLRSLDRAINRVQGMDRGRVIAELTFDFWSNLFRVEYSNFWRTKANIAFPNLARGEGRQEIQTLVKKINRLRNRVAHHEPILDVNVPEHHSRIIELTKLRCGITADWMKHHSTINLVIRSRPTLAGSTAFTLESRLDPKFQIVSSSTSLLELAREEAQTNTAFVCMEGDNFMGAITMQNFARYISAKAIDEDGLIDLNDHTVTNVIDCLELAKCCETLPSNEPFLTATELLKKSKIRVLVGMDPNNAKPVGVILRAHRRY